MTIENKTVLVTGADGFIGSHLVELLLKNNCKVKALAQYNSFNSWGWLDTIGEHKNLEVISGDIRDPHFCKSLTKGSDIVFHLAALIAIPYSYVAPESYVDTNIRGTLNICQAALDNGCQRIIHTSTSEVYGTAVYVPIDEAHPLQPQSPYSASKIGADAIAMSFFNAFKLPLIIARPFNTYGPRQSARAVIPTIISQIAAGKKKINLGDTTPTRDFNYVLDTCQGFIELASCDNAIGRTVNMGSNTETSIADLFKTITGLMHSDAELEVDAQRLRPAGSEVFRLWCNNDLMIELTGFSPKYDIRTGLFETIEWLSKSDNLARYKTNIYNI
jgi:NAD dependent epimerase/dehydratase